MLKVPINNIFVLLSLLLFTTACNKEDEKYAPFVASGMFLTINVLYVDEQGQDLLAQDTDLNSIKIWGRLSNRKIEYRIQKIKIDGVERHVLTFWPDCPDRKYIELVTSIVGDRKRTEGEGTSTVDLSIDRQHFTLQCYFKFVADQPNDGRKYYGLNGLNLESVVCEGVTCRKADFPRDVLIKLRNKNGKIEVLP